MALLRKPASIIGIITAVIFQLFFSIIWLTGYDQINNHVNQFKIAIVNEDDRIGASAAEQLANQLSFKTEILSSVEQAKQFLDERQVQLIIHFPSDFTKQVTDPASKGMINYIVNDSNASMVKSVMQGIAAEVTATINKQSVKSSFQSTLEQLHLPSSQSEQMAASLSERVATQIETVNPVNNFAKLMVPMLLVMASFTGSMLMTMNMNKSANEIKEQFSKWRLFAARALIYVAASFFIALIGTSMVNLLGIHSDQGFTAMWLFQSLIVLSFLFLSQMFFLLLGDAGAWINIALLSIQLLTSGATIPREVLSSFYYGLSSYLPSTYAVNGIMNLVSGGPGIANDSWWLLRITLAIIGISVILVAIRKDGKRTNQTLPASQIA